MGYGAGREDRGIRTLRNQIGTGEPNPARRKRKAERFRTWGLPYREPTRRSRHARADGRVFRQFAYASGGGTLSPGSLKENFGMNRLTLCVALAAAMGMGASLAHADTFTYHGSLQDAGKAANGTYDLQLTLYSAQTGGSVIAGPVSLYGVTVKEGNFVTTVDFGLMTTLTSQGWVDVKVKPANAGAFISLDNRSPVAAPDSACPGSWALDGNAGNPSGSYLGTADNNSVVVKANSNYVAFFNTNQSVGLAYPYDTSGAYSTGIGYNAGTVNEGSIVTGGHSDATFGITIRDTAPNQVILVAQNGVGINTSHAPDGAALRDELTIAPSANLPAGNADLTFETSTSATGYNGFNMGAVPNGYFALNGLYNVAGTLAYDQLLFLNYIHGTTNYAQWRLNGSASTAPFSVGYNTSSGNGAFLSPTGVWTNASSRTFKEAFAAIDPTVVLQKLVAMPVQTWFYKGNHDDGVHMGPVAEDFAKTFGLGSNEKYIGSVDESGVALAAIQGLNKKVDAENAALKQRNADLQSRLESVTARLEKLESLKGE
jgi:hypothetical protein